MTRVLRSLLPLFAVIGLFAAGPAPAQIDADSGASAVGAGSAPSAVLQDDQRGASNDDTTLREDQLAGRRPEPFGSELFPPLDQLQESDFVDPNHIVRPGDTVSVTTFGLTNQSIQTTVDAQGNIALPNIGPVAVAGTPASELNSVVSGAAGNVYQDTVQTYATLASAGQIQVFVTGPVLRPGGHTGATQESEIGFLQRAGGIDPERGSYRHIIVRRGGETVGMLDLYDFLLNGDLSGVNIRSGDVIVVGQQGPIVSVTGDARAPYTFEFENAAGTGGELLLYARPRPEVTHVSVLGTRDGRPYNAYMTREEFASITLFDGDRVRFEADAPADTFVVRVEGATTGPSAYVVNRGDYLGPLLAQIPLDPLADVPMIYLERASIAETQRVLLQENLARLERAIYTDTGSSPGVAQARAAQVPALAAFIQRARQVQPRGLISFPDDAVLDQVLLEPDDVIVIPYQTQTVVIAGEVELPQTMLWTPNNDARDYVERAGGFTRLADRGDTLVIHPDGSVQLGGDVRPGDRILVPPRAPGQTIALIRDIAQILGQTGLAVASIFRIF
ncbi:MAG: polysaccharide biosynthesis/export family protein [Parasphingopyxis sp.]|uniref:polysaccharide biosynthesis/export family protein n=1 Tax=Parasphingopyxis sp. TaxID=1920299 RepID=UPI002602C1F8|nr:polysaccharide biosynthesis/export family protein [uncultured Parasphingopyxis sp.]